MQAKGLLGTILINKEEWIPYLSELEKRATNGRESHRNAYEELKKAKYIRVYRKSGGRGKGVKNYPFVEDIPISDIAFELLKQQADEELSEK